MNAPTVMSWPDHLPTPMLQRVIDAHAILALERAGLETQQRWQASQWRALQDWIAARVPWWRERLGSHTDWTRPEGWPVLERATLQALIAAHGPAPVPAHHGPLHDGRTSGSTGQPVHYHASAFTQRLIDHNYFSDHARQGRNPMALRAVIDGRLDTHEGEHVPELPGPGQGMGPLLRRRDAQFSMAEHADWLMRHRPRYLATTPGWLETLMDAAEQQGLALPRIDQVMPYGSTVTPWLREAVRARLGARIADRYSCQECGPLAFQCPVSDGHLHVAVTNVRLEVVDAAGRACAEGEPGRVLVTALHQYATPLIRYEVGDIAALHAQCPGCGEAIPTLSRLLGRRRFLIRLPDGQLINFRVIASDWLACAPVREHRLVQTTHEDIVAEVVMDRPLTTAERDAIVTMLRRVVHPSLRYEVRQVERIARTGSSKRQDVVSLID